MTRAAWWALVLVAGAAAVVAYAAGRAAERTLEELEAWEWAQ